MTGPKGDGALAPELPEFGPRLSTALSHAGMTPPDVTRAVNALGLPWHRNYIYKFLSGERADPSLSQLAALCRVTNTDPRWFIDPEATAPTRLNP